MHFLSRAGRQGPTLLVLLALATGVPTAARGEDPKFNYGKREEIAKLPPWAATIQAGFGLTTGNAQSINLSGAGNVGYRFSPDDALRLDAGVAFQRSTVQSAVDVNQDGTITPNEVFDITQTVSSAWYTKLRYDHFFDLNAIYAFTSAGGNVPAGQQFLWSAQVGYSRALWKTAANELVAEAGFDYTYQRYVLGNPDSINIAGLRGFLGYVGTPNPDLNYSASVEYIGNMNTLNTPTGQVGAFGDNRLTIRAGVTWTIFGDGSLGFRFRALYDSAPAPKPPPSGFSWAAGYQPLANSWDTFTEFVFLYKLL
jgi:hypothetical protein